MAQWLHLAPATSAAEKFSQSVLKSCSFPNLQPGQEEKPSQYRGVVMQPNGRFGAQIYINQQRIWLGTFSSEDEAAKAYDVAATKLRGEEALTNFPLLQDSEPESAFLRLHTDEQIISMLRGHTYNRNLKVATDHLQEDARVKMHAVAGNFAAVPRKRLFHKVVTPSDVGRLNRLVIPKLHAERWLPLRHEEGLMLPFEDESGKHWMFRYCYWKSSQSYVLTRGWSRFVREKQLEVGDIVFIEQAKDSGLFISCRKRKSLSSSNKSVVPHPGFFGERYWDQQKVHLLSQRKADAPPVYKPLARKLESSPSSNNDVPNKKLKSTIRLFGVTLSVSETAEENV